MHGPFAGELPQLLLVPVLCCTGDSQPSLPVWEPISFWRESETRTFCRKLITEETLSSQVGFMKNGKVKSLEVSYYSNGGNSVDLSHGVSKIFWWLIKRMVFFCATFCSAFRELLPTALLAHATLWHDWKQILKGFWSFYKCSVSQLTCLGMCHIILKDAVITQIEQRGQECLLCITEGCDGKVVAQCKMTDRSPALRKDSSLEREASQSTGWSGQSA